MTTVTVKVRGKHGEGQDMTTTVNHDPGITGITVQVTAEHKTSSCRCTKRARAMTVTVQGPEERKKAKATDPHGERYAPRPPTRKANNVPRPLAEPVD